MNRRSFIALLICGTGAVIIDKVATSQANPLPRAAALIPGGIETVIIEPFLIHPPETLYEEAYEMIGERPNMGRITDFVVD